MQPLVEYQYTGTFFNQPNGKDWTVMALLMNPEDGLGLNLNQDKNTREAIIKSLPIFFEMDKTVFSAPVINAEFINSLVFPNTIPYILKWMCQGDEFLQQLDVTLKETFVELCKSRYDFEPDYKNIKEIAQKLGQQYGEWQQVWNFYANSPLKYPEIESLLREAKPDDLGFGMFELPKASWPQVNEDKEDLLREALKKLVKKDVPDVIKGLQKLEQEHGERRKWVWAELGYAPLVFALEYLVKMAQKIEIPYPANSLQELIQFYTETGSEADTCMRKAFIRVKAEKDKAIISEFIQLLYKPWLEKITEKFQTLIINNYASAKPASIAPTAGNFYLFVDAFRYELAKEYLEMLRKRGLKAELFHKIASLPSLTATAKPKASPVADEISATSEFDNFAPQFKSGKPVIISNFRNELELKGFIHSEKKGFDPNKSYWVEIGSLDTRGHDEQAEMLKRVAELFEEITEIIDIAMENGIKDIKIVTDHGWLMLPGGLASAKIVKDLTVARCGRCALIKEGIKTDLVQLPWEWNANTFIAYAPGISFFRKNEEYAHGGISLQECVIPELMIHNDQPEFVNAKIINHKWVNLRCNIETENAPDGFKIDIRTKYTDENSSVVLSATPIISANKCSLIVDDSKIDSAAFIVLTNEQGKIIDKITTIIGN